MADTRVNEINQLFDTLKTDRSNWLSVWKDVTNYVVQRRGDWEIENTPGKRPETKIYDITALACLNLHVDGFQGYMVSQALNWFKLALQNPDQQKLPGVADWLEKVERIIYATFQRSNFYEAMNEYLTDGCSLGTAVQFVEDDVANRSVVFSTRHLKEVYLAEGKDGTVDSVYREYAVTNRQAGQRWGSKLGEKALERAKTHPFEKRIIRHVVRPRTDRDPAKIDSLNSRWEEIYLDKTEGTVIEEGGYNIFPYLVWRYRKNSDEIYGRSPAIDGLPLIIRLNQVAKTSLQAAQLAVEPPLNVPAAMKGLERIVPRGYNYYTNPSEVITPINLAANYPISKDQENELREELREIFRTRIFLLMEQLEKSGYTATEIRERQGEKAAVLGSTIGRFNAECLTPLIHRTYEICKRNGQIPLPPTSLKDAIIKVEFQGVLAQAQKRYHESQGVKSGLELLPILAKLNGEALDNIDFDELTRQTMESAGVPQAIIREALEVKRLRKDRAELMLRQQQQVMALEQQKLAASNADKLNQPMNPNGLLASAMQARGAA